MQSCRLQKCRRNCEDGIFRNKWQLLGERALFETMQDSFSKLKIMAVYWPTICEICAILVGYPL